MRLPYSHDLPRGKAPPPKGWQRAVACIQSLDPRPHCKTLAAFATDFLQFWFGAIRFDHTAENDIHARLEELQQAYKTCNCDMRREKIMCKYRQLEAANAHVKFSTRKRLQDSVDTRGVKHFGRVKRPRRPRNTAVVHPDAPQEKPVIRLKVVCAADLRRSDWTPAAGFMPPDPYCICEVKGKGHYEPYETEVQNHTQDPVWNEEHEFREYVTGDALEFQIWDKDPLGSDFLGKGKLLAKDFFPDGFYGKVLLSQTGQADKASYLTIQVRVAFPQALGWGGDPLRKRDAPHGWQAGEFEEQKEDEGIVMQSLPIFVVLQAIVASVLWLFFADARVYPMAGLEALFPGQTALMLQKDCVEDYRMQVWRWVAYQFTHVGLSHIGMNCLMLLIMGIPLEGFNGTLKTMAMFNIGVLGGALCWMVASVHAITVGMSGGCYSLIGIMLGDLLMNWAEMKYAKTMLFMILLIPAVDLTIGHFAAAENVSNAAHFGGFVTGLITCIVVGRNMVVTSIEKKVSIAAIVVGVVLTIFCLVWGLSSPVPEDIWEQTRYCWRRQVISQSLFGDTQPHCVRCDSLDCISRWASAVGSCEGECIMGTVSAAACSRYGWSDVKPPPAA